MNSPTTPVDIDAHPSRAPWPVAVACQEIGPTNKVAT
jgi:hypothetical protein